MSATTASPDLEPHVGDFFGYETLLPAHEQSKILRLREFLDTEVRPIADEYWAEAKFPDQLIPGLRDLDIVGGAYEGFSDNGDQAYSRLFSGFTSLEMSRVDPSFSTFFGVHAGLSFASIYHCGSPEQRERWLPAMADLRSIGAFALTEPEHGSDIAGGLETSARKVDGGWVLNGKKRWIGNGTFADVVVLWARDVESEEVVGFVVEGGTPGFTATKITGKIALRSVQNADLELVDVFLPDDHRLENARSFKDTANVLRITRGGVAWGSVGLQMGAYETALAYVMEREQFGKPLAGFQLVQDHLATMLSNITLALGMVVRLAQMQDAGIEKDEHAAMAKASASSLMRETVGIAREVMGGNGIVLDHGMVRYFADAEAVYSYEGTREVNQLIVGRAITGTGAFV